MSIPLAVHVDRCLFLAWLMSILLAVHVLAAALVKTVPASHVDVKATMSLKVVAALSALPADSAEVFSAALVEAFEVNPDPYSIRAEIYQRRIHIEDCVDTVQPLELDP